MATDLILRASDQGPTYLSWRMLDRPDVVDYGVLSSPPLLDAFSELELALPHPRPGESDHEAVHRALSDGGFSDPPREESLSKKLSAAVLPHRLAQLLSTFESDDEVFLRVMPSPRLSRLPWELLILPDGRRLIDVAQITVDPPAALKARRDRLPIPWSEVEMHPALYVIDPDLRSHGRPSSIQLGSVLESDGAVQLRSWLINAVADKRADSDDLDRSLRGHASRRWLGSRLRERRWSRLVYYGHASADSSEPAAAAIHLADSSNDYGLAAAIADHRPFSALDLLMGTSAVANGVPNAALPISDRKSGADIWPMPSRVVLLGCETGGNYMQIEPFGLVIALLNAGAELVTATRWTLPTDSAFHSIHPNRVPGHVKPTTTLMLELDDCHRKNEPTKSFRHWQREQLRNWVQSGRIENTPLLWGSTLTYRMSA